MNTTKEQRGWRASTAARAATSYQPSMIVSVIWIANCAMLDAISGRPSFRMARRCAAYECAIPWVIANRLRPDHDAPSSLWRPLDDYRRPDILCRQLAANNTKDWWEANRGTYDDHLKPAALALVGGFDARLLAEIAGEPCDRQTVPPAPRCAVLQGQDAL